MEDNSIQYNNIAGIYLNNSLINNITTNTIEYQSYAIYLYSSNHTFIIRNTGYVYIFGIMELTCDETKLIISREIILKRSLMLVKKKTMITIII